MKSNIPNSNLEILVVDEYLFLHPNIDGIYFLIPYFREKFSEELKVIKQMKDYFYEFDSNLNNNYSTNKSNSFNKNNKNEIMFSDEDYERISNLLKKSLDDYVVNNEEEVRKVVLSLIKRNLYNDINEIFKKYKLELNIGVSLDVEDSLNLINQKNYDLIITGLNIPYKSSFLNNKKFAFTEKEYEKYHLLHKNMFKNNTSEIIDVLLKEDPSGDAAKYFSVYHTKCFDNNFLRSRGLLVLDLAKKKKINFAVLSDITTYAEEFTALFEAGYLSLEDYIFPLKIAKQLNVRSRSKESFWRGLTLKDFYRIKAKYLKFGNCYLSRKESYTSVLNMYASIIRNEFFLI